MEGKDGREDRKGVGNEEGERIGGTEELRWKRKVDKGGEERIGERIEVEEKEGR